MKRYELRINGRRRLGRLGALVLLAGLGLSARAQSVLTADAARLVTSPNGWAVSRIASDPTFTNLMQRTLTGTSEGAREFSRLLAKPYTGAGPAAISGEVTMGITRTVTAGALADAALPLGIAFAAGFTTGAVIYDAVTGERYYASMVDGWMRDEGALPNSSQTSPARWCSAVSGNTRGNACALGPSGATAEALGATLMQKDLDDYNSANPPAIWRSAATFNGPMSFTVWSFDSMTARRPYKWTAYNNAGACGRPAEPACTADPVTGQFAREIFAYCANGTSPHVGAGGVATCHIPAQICPASTDALNPALNVPAGAPPMADGKCRTGRYNKVPADDIAFREMGQRQFKGNVGKAVAEAVLAAGGSIAAGPGTMSGPGTLNGPTTVTTGPSPDGQGQTTTTTEQGWRFGYATPDKVTSSPWKRETTVGPDGVPKVVETGVVPGTETPPSEGGDGGSDPCVANPDRVGCQDMGDPPDEEIPRKNRELTWEAEDIGLPVGCPDPISLDIDGTPRLVSYEHACDAATRMAPFIKAAAALSALMIVLAALRQL